MEAVAKQVIPFQVSLFLASLLLSSKCRLVGIHFRQEMFVSFHFHVHTPTNLIYIPTSCIPWVPILYLNTYSRGCRMVVLFFDEEMLHVDCWDIDGNWVRRMRRNSYSCSVDWSDEESSSFIENDFYISMTRAYWHDYRELVIGWVMNNRPQD